MLAHKYDAKCVKHFAGAPDHFAGATDKDKDGLIKSLLEQQARSNSEASTLRKSVAELEQKLAKVTSDSTPYYASQHVVSGHDSLDTIPIHGMPSIHALEKIKSVHLCDFNPQLNTSS